MRSTPLLLVGSDQHPTPDVLTFLRDNLAYASSLYSFDSIQEQLGLFSRCTLICVAGSPADVAPIVALVREISLREWPVAVVLVEASEVSKKQALAGIEAYISCRVAWPDEAMKLATLPSPQQPVRVDRAHTFFQGRQAALADLLALRLLNHTPSLAPLIEPLTLAASHDVTVLLTGPTGTGKTHVARLIHEHSARKSHRMMVVPCGALASNLIESELFGHAKGAFTGADRTKVGKFEAVGEGTLLLDEIDTLALEHQAKLLRVIETGAYEAVGSNDTCICRARIIAASNWDLEGAVREGKFREDLYYRLNVLAIHLEPLANRPEDIGPLARGMAAEFSAKFQKELFAVHPETIAALEAFPWPGNIRQLENVMQQAVLVSTGTELLPQHLPRLVREYAASPRSSVAVPAANGSLVENRDQHERTIIELALRESHNCRVRAAHVLGISRATLYNKMKKYGIARVRAY